MGFYLVAAVNLEKVIFQKPSHKFEKSTNVTPFHYQLLDYSSFTHDYIQLFYNQFGSILALLKVDVNSREELDEVYRNYEEHYKKILTEINYSFQANIKETSWVCKLSIGDGRPDVLEWDKLFFGESVELDAVVDTFFVQISYEMLKKKIEDFKLMNMDSYKLLQFKELFFELNDLTKVENFRSLDKSIQIGTSILKAWRFESYFEVLERLYREELSSYSLHMELKNHENSQSLNSILFVVALFGLAQLSDFFAKKFGDNVSDFIMDVILYAGLLILGQVIYRHVKNILIRKFKKQTIVRR